MKEYVIGNLRVRIDEGPITIEDDLLTSPFLSTAEGREPILEIRCMEADLTFLQDWEVEIYTGAYEIRKGQGRRFLLNHWMTYRYAFGLYLDELFGGGDLCLYCNKNIGEPIALTAAHFMGMAGLHHRLLKQTGVILHASYISHNGKGILFAAPSQTGKSTQAELWKTYAGAEILNGDRALVFNREGRWYAGGYIACGSSGVCRNESYPLQAIVFLEQGPDNTIRPAAGKEIVRGLLAGMETFHWSVEDTDLALALASRIGAEVPVLHYSCRPDEDAVYTLKHYLEEMCPC